jgi:pyridoxal/pyridoxine/pyridoxamine kinase
MPVSGYLGSADDACVLVDWLDAIRAQAPQPKFCLDPVRYPHRTLRGAGAGNRVPQTPAAEGVAAHVAGLLRGPAMPNALEHAVAGVHVALEATLATQCEELGVLVATMDSALPVPRFPAIRAT